MKDEKLTGFQNASTLVDINFSFTKEHPILVVTDEISRGHHIAGVADVINYDLPDTCAVFLERTGKFSLLFTFTADSKVTMGGGGNFISIGFFP